MASSEYMFKGELNCWDKICFWFPPMFIFLAWWGNVEIGDGGGIWNYVIKEFEFCVDTAFLFCAIFE